MAKKKSQAVVKREPERVLVPFEETERWFEDFFRRPFPLMGPRWWPSSRMPEFEAITPSVDIYEEGDDVIVKAELPGMKKEDIDVTLTEHTLTLSGEKKKGWRRRIITGLNGRMALSPAPFVFLRRFRPRRSRPNSKTAFWR